MLLQLNDGNMIAPLSVFDVLGTVEEYLETEVHQYLEDYFSDENPWSDLPEDEKVDLAIPFQLCCAFKHVFAREQGVGSVFTGADHPERGEWSVLPLVFLDRLLGLKEPGTGRDSIGTIAKRDIHCSKGSWSDSNA